MKDITLKYGKLNVRDSAAKRIIAANPKYKKLVTAVQKGVTKAISQMDPVKVAGFKVNRPFGFLRLFSNIHVVSKMYEDILLRLVKGLAKDEIHFDEDKFSRLFSKWILDEPETWLEGHYVLDGYWRLDENATSDAAPYYAAWPRGFEDYMAAEHSILLSRALDELAWTYLNMLYAEGLILSPAIFEDKVLVENNSLTEEGSRLLDYEHKYAASDYFADFKTHAAALLDADISSKFIHLTAGDFYGNNQYDRTLYVNPLNKRDVYKHIDLSNPQVVYANDDLWKKADIIREETPVYFDELVFFTDRKTYEVIHEQMYDEDDIAALVQKRPATDWIYRPSESETISFVLAYQNNLVEPNPLLSSDDIAKNIGLHVGFDFELAPYVSDYSLDYAGDLQIKHATLQETSSRHLTKYLADTNVQSDSYLFLKFDYVDNVHYMPLDYVSGAIRSS